MKSSFFRALFFAFAAGSMLLPGRLRADGDKGGVTQAVFRLNPEIDCPGCETRIHDLLAKARGVQKVDIDVMANHVVVRYDAGKCTVGALIGRIGVTGYQATQVK